MDTVHFFRSAISLTVITVCIKNHLSRYIVDDNKYITQAISEIDKSKLF